MRCVNALRLGPASVLALALLAVLPAAAAVGEEVDIVAVRAPERTAAGHAFDARVDLHNKGAAREVYLFAALYEGDAEEPCGPAGSPRWRGFTPLVQAVVDLPAGARVTYPPEGQRWAHRYGADQVERAVTTDEWCVFVAEDDAAPSLRYLDLESVALATRGQNAPPSGSFAFAPDPAPVAADVRFEATGTDADGDPLVFRWDFGHANASGRGRAEGAVAFHPFYPEGTYAVTLTVSDGFDEAVVARDVAVLPADAVPPPAPVTSVARDPVPAPLLLPALLVAALHRARRG